MPHLTPTVTSGVFELAALLIMAPATAIVRFRNLLGRLSGRRIVRMCSQVYTLGNSSYADIPLQVFSALICYLCYLVFPKGAFLVHFYSFSLLMTSLSLSARPPCSSLLTMLNVSVPLLTLLTAFFYKKTLSGFWIGVTNGNFILTFPSVLLFVFPMEPQFSVPLPIAWVIKI